jgi:hypothetical protein
MPDGKPAGVACIQLDAQQRCRLFGDPRRPAVCSSLAPSVAMCGNHREYALRWLSALEAATAPTGRTDPDQDKHAAIGHHARVANTPTPIPPRRPDGD